MDSALRDFMLRALGLDLDIAANVEHDIAVDLISGCDWWRRFARAWRNG